LIKKFAAKEKLEIVIGAAPPPFRIFARGFPRPALFAKRAGRNAFGLIQEYSTKCRLEPYFNFGKRKFFTKHD